MKKFSLAEALFWIVGSTLFITGGGNMAIQHYAKQQRKERSDSRFFINRIVQTGPEKTPLNTAYLAELMGISQDRPTLAAMLDCNRAQSRLTASPVIKEARVKVLDPATIYVNYTVRKPVAALADFDNVALDDEGVPFPITPFFTPKTLPQLYLGIDQITYRKPLQGKGVTLALNLLKLFAEERFPLKRLDLSKAFHPSLGRREIVVVTEDQGSLRYLRLSQKNILQELANYLELRPELPLTPQIIDLRIPQIGIVNTTPELPPRGYSTTHAR
jgi:hypothetical protein